MDKTNRFYATSQRWLAAWRGVAQLGMLVDGRTHTWAGDAASSEPERGKMPASPHAADAPRLARLAA